MSNLKRFVTAKLKDVPDCRQGVVIEESADTLVILGESGTVYQCEPHPAIVPLENLWGTTRVFAIGQGVKA